MLSAIMGRDTVIGLYERMYLEAITILSKKVDTSYAGFDKDNPNHNPRAKRKRRSLSQRKINKFRDEGLVLEFDDDNASIGKMNGSTDDKGELQRDIMTANMVEAENGITKVALVLTFSGY